MCRRRISSAFGTLHFGLVYYRLSEISTEILGRPQVDPTAKHHGQLALHARDAKEARDLCRIELDEYVDVTVRAEVWPQYRPVQGQPTDIVATAKGLKLLTIDGYTGRHHSISTGCRLWIPIMYGPQR